jgi:predicted ArsR family transcriptional regulator
VLLCLARDPDIRLRDVATLVGLTERAAQSIVADLETEGFLSRSKVGRRNRYEIHTDAPVRHHDGELTIGELLAFLGSPAHRASLGHATVVQRETVEREPSA